LARFQGRQRLSPSPFPQSHKSHSSYRPIRPIPEKPVSPTNSVSLTDNPPQQENPFNTRHIRPGAMPFLFSPGQSPEALLERLRLNGWRGEITGDHGSGKSALLATIIPAIERAGRQPLLVELHDAQRRLPIDLKRDSRLRPNTVLVVDGYEQLSFWSRFWLKSRCRRRGWGLLVTAHASVGFPPLFQTTVTLDLAKRIIDQLTAGRMSSLSNEELADCLARHRGNLRESLFDLYDLFERRRPSK
jgi:hypothetical protein